MYACCGMMNVLLACFYKIIVVQNCGCSVPLCGGLFGNVCWDGVYKVLFLR